MLLEKPKLQEQSVNEQEYFEIMFALKHRTFREMLEDKRELTFTNKGWVTYIRDIIYLANNPDQRLFDQMTNFTDIADYKNFRRARGRHSPWTPMTQSEWEDYHDRGFISCDDESVWERECDVELMFGSYIEDKYSTELTDKEFTILIKGIKFLSEYPDLGNDRDREILQEEIQEFRRLYVQELKGCV